MVVVLTVLAGSGWALAAEEKTMPLGSSEVLDFAGIKRAAVVDPSVADYVVLSAKQIMITTKAPGATDFHVWDEKGQHTYRLIVVAPPSRMPETLKRIQDALARPGIKVSEINGVVVLEGEVDSPYESQRAEGIASAYAPKVRNLIQVRPAAEKPKLDMAAIQEAVGADIKVRTLGENTLLFEGTATPEQKARLAQIMKALQGQATIVDMVAGASYTPRQILVHVKVVDVNKSALNDVGVDWGGLQETREVQRDEFGNIISDTIKTVFHDQPILFGEVFSLAPNTPAFKAANDVGPIRRLDLLGAQLKALVTDNKAKVLAEPNLLVSEGETANMLVGGEIPIPVVQTTAGVGTAATGAITVQWKEFGVRLEIKGTITPDAKSLDLDVTPEVSSLDFANAIVVSNILLPALRTRRAHSVVHIGDGQTLVIGGLYQNEISNDVRKIPLLGDIPIIGEFFKHRVKSKTETELMIFVTPEIVTEASAKARTDAALETLGKIQ
jgi:pilus assembly protein CpaC